MQQKYDLVCFMSMPHRDGSMILLTDIVDGAG
jgi:hypothetical protein